MENPSTTTEVPDHSVSMPMDDTITNEVPADTVSIQSQVSSPPKYDEYEELGKGLWHTRSAGSISSLPPPYCQAIPIKVDVFTPVAVTRPQCKNRVRRACAGVAIACVILSVMAICLGIGLARLWPSSRYYYYGNTAVTTSTTAGPGLNGYQGVLPNKNVVNPPTACGTRSVPANTTGAYIINGQLAARGAWPWQVSVIYTTGFMSVLCGGSLLSDRWVLTAASCAQRFSNTNLLSIRLGSLLITGFDPDAQVLGVDRVFMNPSYSNNLPAGSTVTGDVALLHLSTTATFTDTVRPICYPTTAVDPSQYKVCVATGFGDTSYYQTMFDVTQSLMQGALQPISSGACLTAFTTLTGKTWNATASDFTQFFCAGSTAYGSTNICLGDGGGPLSCKDASGVWTVVGVSSFVVKACQLSVFATVSSYSPWIQTTMANN